MHLFRSFILGALMFCLVGTASAAQSRIVKVLPHYLDSKGRHTLAPSLFERDAYQKFLRDNPELRSALRFDVQHSPSRKGEELKLKVELRVVKDHELKVETKEAPAAKNGVFRTWSAVEFSETEFKRLGEITAWRVTLWKNGQQVAEQKSFLW